MERRIVKSAMRTFEVLELFQEERRPLRLQEIYSLLDYPQSSTTNLLKSMVMMGYLNYNLATRTYLPTRRVSNLGGWLPLYFNSNGPHQWLVQELCRRTDETTALCSQNDLFVQYVILAEPDHEFKLPPPQGSLRMMVDATGGLALMSGMSDRQIDKICRYTNYYDLGRRDDFYGHNEKKRVSIDEVMMQIQYIRHVGYAYRCGTPTPDLASLAIPLDGDPNGIPLSLGVGGVKDRINAKKSYILATMRELVAEFNARLAELPVPASANDEYAATPPFRPTTPQDSGMMLAG
jgi:DNA-binding IclR family transcriptional regulator